MKCPECVKAGTPSRVLVGGSSSTCMYCAPHYDEEGVYHFHDANTITSHYSCSNGHSWTTGHRGKCPVKGCDWNKPEAP